LRHFGKIHFFLKTCAFSLKKTSLGGGKTQSRQPIIELASVTAVSASQSLGPACRTCYSAPNICLSVPRRRFLHSIPRLSSISDAWGRRNVVTPFHHLSGDSHLHRSLGAGPITASRACTHKSAFCKRGLVNVRFAPKADKQRTSRDVRFVPKVAGSKCSKAALIRSPRRRGSAHAVGFRGMPAVRGCRGARRGRGL
jgi:hypothetical protein